MKVLDLFSGIGGFSLGLERAGMRTIAFCELDDYARRVLRQHWPEVPIYENFFDICWLSLPELERGGQAAGTIRSSLESRLKPDWILIENVAHTWRRWVPELRRELWQRGYASLPIQVRADQMGFCHRRARCFLIAHTDSEQLWKLKRWWSGPGRQVAKELAESWDSAPERLGTDDGIPKRTHRLRCLGNAVVPQVVELIGRAIMEIDNGS